MSQAKRRGFRKVLKIERFEKTEGALKFPVTIVTWAIIARENSKAVFTRHLALMVYVGDGPNNHGVEAYISSKKFRVPKNLEGSKQYESLLSRVSKAYTHALFAYLGKSQKPREGTVIWYDPSDGIGMLRDDETELEIHFNACNFEGADSAFPELVKNVKVDRGDRLRYLIHKDPFVSLHCGAIGLKAVA